MEEHEMMNNDAASDESGTMTDAMPMQEDAPPASTDMPADAQGMEAAPMDPGHVGENISSAAHEAIRTGEAVTIQPEAAKKMLLNLGVDTVYLMGSSFILGVLFTIFILLVLDFMRRNSEDKK